MTIRQTVRDEALHCATGISVRRMPALPPLRPPAGPSAASSAIASVGRPPKRGTGRLPPSVRTPILPGMMVVTETEAAAIRAAFEQRGELSAAVELRRLFPGITDTAQARECARTIAGWKPLPGPLRRVRRGRPK